MSIRFTEDEYAISDGKDILKEARFLLEVDEERHAIVISPTVKNEPLCLTDKEALALAAIIRDRTQSWCKR